jgi:TPR repeat protein
LILTAAACAEGYEAGLAAYESGDYQTAFRIWEPLAAEGDSRAQYGLGYMYDNGLGLPKNPSEAVDWYRRAAEQGNPEAQWDLALLYTKGREGIPFDMERAAEWYRKVAEQGHAKAQHFLGKMYYLGDGVPKNYDEAAKWSRMAADQGDAQGQNLLGVLYWRGFGVPEDPAQAVRWICMAAEQELPGAYLNLATMHMRGRGVPQDFVKALMWFNLFDDTGKTSIGVQGEWITSRLNEEEIAEARRLADQWRAGSRKASCALVSAAEP